MNKRYYDCNVCRFISIDDIYNITTSLEDLFDKNLYYYCNNDPVNNSDKEGGFWFRALVGAVVGALVSGVSTVVSNAVNGRKWNEGLAGSMVGGAVAGAVGFVTGSATLANYAGAAAESATNEIIKYATGKQEINGKNLLNSLGNIVKDTAIDGTINLVMDKLGGGKTTGVFINPGWFKPKKFVSCVVGKYAKRFMKQTVLTGLYSFLMDELLEPVREELNELRKKRHLIPKPNAPVFA